MRGMGNMQKYDAADAENAKEMQAAQKNYTRQNSKVNLLLTW